MRIRPAYRRRFGLLAAGLAVAAICAWVFFRVEARPQAGMYADPAATLDSVLDDEGQPSTATTFRQSAARPTVREWLQGMSFRGDADPWIMELRWVGWSGREKLVWLVWLDGQWSPLRWWRERLVVAPR